VVSGRCSSPLLAAAVEEADVAVPVELERPVGVGGEPVVVAAVEHDGVVVRDALGREQGGEGVGVDHVASYGMAEVVAPVQPDRAGDVVDGVPGRVLVDLDHDQSGPPELLLEPGAVHEYVGASHGVLLS